MSWPGGPAWKATSPQRRWAPAWTRRAWSMTRHRLRKTGAAIIGADARRAGAGGQRGGAGGRPFAQVLSQAFHQADASQRDDLTLAFSAQLADAGVQSSACMPWLGMSACSNSSWRDTQVPPDKVLDLCAGDPHGQWRKSKPDDVYTAEEVLARLNAELPKWTSRRLDRRKYKTTAGRHSHGGEHVGHLARPPAPPDLTVSYAFVNVKLMNHAPRASPTRTSRLPRRSRRC